MPDSSASLGRWQRRLDSLFPQGAVAEWQHPGNPVRYRLAWIRAEDMEGLDPVLALYCIEPRVLDGLRLISMETVPDSSPLLYRIKTAARSDSGWEPEDPIQLCAAVPPGMIPQAEIVRSLVKQGLGIGGAR
jgi:hypothetical protein